MPRVLVFDVNETLLDLKALDPIFTDIFGDAAARGQWFTQFIHNAFVSIITNHYAPFGQIGMGALEMVAVRRGITLTQSHKQRVGATLSSLPPHPEVAENLAKLKSAGFRMVALTNSTLQVAENQLTNAEIRPLFDAVFSADEVQRLKPSPEPYHMTAERMGVSVDQIRMVAAHAWDIAGALRVGCAGAFIARPGMVLDPLVARPDVVGADLTEVVAQIITAEIQ